MDANLDAQDLPDKADGGDFPARFREIVSDPLNLLIERVPMAGTVSNGFVVLHNGIRVPVSGAGAYYGNFSLILVVNRGVHEPLEEYVFQEFLARVPAAPTMLELGAYWGHYSMWMKLRRPDATCFLVEPDATNLAAGRENFARHGFAGEFVHRSVGAGQFAVDDFMEQQKLAHLDILHSDIQGAEVEMLVGARSAFEKKAIDFVFVSTHSSDLHGTVEDLLLSHGYRVEIGCDFEDSTSYDGFVFATAPHLKRVFDGFAPLGRTDIAMSKPGALLAYLPVPSKR